MVLCRRRKIELYDVKTDPYEWTNLAPLADHAAKLEALRAQAVIPKDQ